MRPWHCVRWVCLSIMPQRWLRQVTCFGQVRRQMPGCGEEGKIEARWEFSFSYFLFFHIQFLLCIFVPLPPGCGATTLCGVRASAWRPACPVWRGDVDRGPGGPGMCLPPDKTCPERPSGRGGGGRRSSASVGFHHCGWCFPLK